jgi:hypothetical protein
VPVDQDQPPSRPARSNGLPAHAWTPVADLDPRIAGDVLITMHANGIAAYVEPTPAAVGGYLDRRLPTRLTDRLFADAAETQRARSLVAAELAESEAIEAGSGVLLAVDVAPSTAPVEDDHFSPPAPPPLPRLRPSTVGSLAAIVLGVVILVSGYDGGEFGVLGVIAIVGGIGSLVWHMKDGPPGDSGWDDGAVL